MVARGRIYLDTAVELGVLELLVGQAAEDGATDAVLLPEVV
jgi:hypothetical protein